MKIILSIVLALGLVGCACGQPVATAPVQSASCAQAVAPQVAGYSIGPESYIRGTLAVPGEFVQCVGTFLQCSLDSLFPKPVPTPVFAGAPLASQAAPCAQAAPLSDPCSYTLPQTVTRYRTETYVENVPVQRTRTVPVTETIHVPAMLVPCEPPAPAAAPSAAPCDPPTSAPPSGSASDPFACCPNGCCGVPVVCR